MSGFFITGTDTSCGKTHSTHLILRALREAGRPALPFKPICCGDRDDIHNLTHACTPPRTDWGESETSLHPDTINPLWLKTPAAPLVAAQFDHATLDESALDQLVSAHRAYSEAHPNHCILTEGAGGWDVPLTPTLSTAHLAQKIGHPIILIVGNKLGALNHTLLTLRAIRESGQPIAGLILNQLNEEQDIASVSNGNTLEQLIPEKILGEIIHNADFLDEELTENLLALL